jgi:hypothetical protein
MRRVLSVALLGVALLAATAGPARAQFLGGTISGGGYSVGWPAPYGIPPYFGAPGYYGMGYGVPSFGFPRTYTVYSSPYGAGYGYGYAPYGFLPGRYGVGLWRPGIATPGYVYGSSYYRTFPVPYRPLTSFYSPAVGYYAPGFGPPSFYAQ